MNRKFKQYLFVIEIFRNTKWAVVIQEKRKEIWIMLLFFLSMYNMVTKINDNYI